MSANPATSSRSAKAAVFTLLLATLGFLAFNATAARAAESSPHWIVTWGTSAAKSFTSDTALTKSNLLFKDQTLREIVHISAGGPAVRVCLANTFGRTAVRIGAVSLQTRDGLSHPLTFSGQTTFSIPANAKAISDPVSLKVSPDSDVAINIFLPEITKGAAVHYHASQTSYLEAGNTTAETTWPEHGGKVAYWAFLSDVDVLAPNTGATVVALGDSITDGYRSTPNANHRWPDDLARRFEAWKNGPVRGVLNSGISGNRLLYDAVTRQLSYGVSGMSRFDRDVLARPGVRYLIVLEGINDIGIPGDSAARGVVPAAQSVTADDLIWGITQLAQRAHEFGIKVVVGTLTPFKGFHPGYYTPENDQIREKVNAWIRRTHVIDAVIDFDKVLRDPQHPDQLLHKYDSGDHLHPNDSGYQAMANAINLSLFR